MSRRLTQLAAIPVSQLRGVGVAKVKAFEQLDVRSVLDLLTYYPRRYLDRTNEARIEDLVPGDTAMVLARVRSVRSQTTRNRKRMVTVDVSDEAYLDMEREAAGAFARD